MLSSVQCLGVLGLGAGSPSLTRGKTRFTYSGDAEHIALEAFPDLGGRSHLLTADIVVPSIGAQGVVAAEGGRYGGWTLYVQDGRLVYETNIFNIIRERIVSSEALPAGKVQVAVEFGADDVKPFVDGANASMANLTVSKKNMRGGQARLSIAGKIVGEGHLSKFGGFNGFDAFDVGHDNGSPVSDAYAVPFPFNGVVEKGGIDLK